VPLPERVTVVEVGPRDGLQNVDRALDVEAKVRFVEALAAAGLPVVEAGAFVSRRAVPQMAESGEVFRRAARRAGTRYAALVPNLRGLEEALAVGADEVAVFTAASETFNRRNVGATIAESLARFDPVLARARAEGLRVRGYVSCAFGCPYEGAIAPAAVAGVTRALFDLGVAEVSVGDTIGVATPNQVDAVMTPLAAAHGAASLALHFHDTRGTALANVLRALELGFSIFDASAGGLGGCPFAPGASGNLATEDLVYLLHGMSIPTGVDLDAVARASAGIEQALGTRLPGRVYRALAATRG